MVFSALNGLARWTVPVAAAAAVAVVAGFVSEVNAGGQPRPTGPSIELVSEANPLAGKTFYVDPISVAMRAAKNASPPSPELTAIANTPTAYWLDEAFPVSSVGTTVGRYAGSAQSAGALPIFALYAIPHRDCGSFAAGGFGSAASYRQWIDAIATGLAGMPAVFIVEPDALAMADCLAPDAQQERFDLISYAVDTLTANPAAVVYIDGGHSRWISVDLLAARLNQVGVDRARGFSLNTANFYTTEEQIGYGEAVSGLTNGAHYVIDTSRNGAGPVENDPLNWCNPGGRALGAAPTANTAGAHADAYLWVKRPGESDGACDPGEARAGQFIHQYAIELVRNAGG